MPPSFDPVRVRALAEQLVAVPSVSPDEIGETRCGRALLSALPAGLEQGVWRLRDRREGVWARLRAAGTPTGGARRGPRPPRPPHTPGGAPDEAPRPPQGQGGGVQPPPPPPGPQ